MIPVPAAQTNDCSGTGRAILGGCRATQLGAGCREGRGGECPLSAPVHTLAHTNTHARTAAAQWGNTEGIKHLALLECLPWEQAKDMCPRAPGSNPLATIYPGETLFLRGNEHSCFYVSRTRVSVWFSSADIPCTPRGRIPPFLPVSPIPFQLAGSFIRDAQCPKGRWLLKRTAYLFLVLFFSLRSWRWCWQPDAVSLPPSPLPCLSPREWGGKSVGGGRSCGPQMCELLPNRNSALRTDKEQSSSAESHRFGLASLTFSSRPSRSSPDPPTASPALCTQRALCTALRNAEQGCHRSLKGWGRGEWKKEEKALQQRQSNAVIPCPFPWSSGCHPAGQESYRLSHHTTIPAWSSHCNEAIAVLPLQLAELGMGEEK